ncbi:hypothetical protein CWI38_1938p0010 [Hamiltosporidium tvaerminnensis]|uniref:Uncharacterized protein n=1 Tax=Hamiltosporidium tvaerminnensis TaxID=1176355 RepID=A0A4V2JX26_9MICR|nr:hypothetical protein CWI38_1938p0010 [Hamiltosporidium tvaerminnensis]
MLVFNLDLSKTNDFSETLVKKNESLNVYQRKLTMYENRKKFRRENRVFKISERVTYDDYLIPFVSDTDQATCLSLEEL